MTYKTMREHLADHIEAMNPDQFAQIQDVNAYLAEAAQRGSLAEGSVSALLNRQDPATRKAFKMLSEIVESPRERPFEPKLTEAEIFDKLGMDSQSGVQIKAALDASHVIAETVDRLGGSDQSRPDEPLNMRDNLEAAFTEHEGAEHD